MNAPQTHEQALLSLAKVLEVTDEKMPYLKALYAIKQKTYPSPGEAYSAVLIEFLSSLTDEPEQA